MTTPAGSSRRVVSLRLKTLFAIGATMALLMLIIYLPLRWLLLDSFRELEAHNLRTNVGRAASSLEALGAGLNRTAGDYATWDDTYQYMVDRNSRYIEQNMTDAVFVNNQQSLVLLLDPAGAPVFAKAFDLESGAQTPLPTGLEQAARERLNTYPAVTSAITGLVAAPDGLYLVAARPIITSLAAGPSRGTLVMGRALSPQLVRDLADSTRLDLLIQPLGAARLPTEFAQARDQLALAPELMTPLDSRQIAAYQLLRDVYGEPAAVLRVVMARDIHQRGQTAIAYLQIAILVAGLSVGAAMLFVVERIVLARLVGLSRRVQEIGGAPDLGARVPVQGNDELTGLATTINGMLGSMEQAQSHLTRWVRELERHNHEISLLNEMGDLLQASSTPQEAYGIIAHSVQLLFPRQAGGLYVLNQASTVLESVAIWGDAEAGGVHMFVADACCALRRRRMYVLQSPQTDEPVCQHLPGVIPPQYLCLPMMAQGEPLGLLHLRSNAPSGCDESFLSESNVQLAAAVVEHVALALANLRLRETLHHQAIRDPLTNLFNRRYMEETLERELVRAAREYIPLGLILIDLDYFKRINDTFGHPAGDFILCEIAVLLQTSVRLEDVVCRYGGEEFIIIMPGAPLQVIEQRTEHIRQQIRGLSLEHQGQPLGQVTLSVGIAVYPEHGLTSRQLLRAADEALYAAKHDGRDRIRLARNPLDAERV
ncbi:MAG TPA: diguanylate cyclase [Herpetosiphonaceae bacterium]